MNESVVFNITSPDTLQNATALVIDNNPLYGAEIVLWLIFSALVFYIFLVIVLFLIMYWRRS